MIDRLRREIQGTIGPDEQLYYFTLGFGEVPIRKKQAILTELENALDVRYLEPAPAELDTSTTTVDLVFVTSIQSAIIENALDPTDVAFVEYRELEPEALDVSVIDAEAAEPSDPDLFETVREEYEHGQQPRPQGSGLVSELPLWRYTAEALKSPFAFTVPDLRAS
ncbi:hypothetical protein [Natronosalvus rutilus]|uniref:Uncharacterized protein n=1 Tax=Natronosalvus rutilus TaxID=2953753 RepID=A0A9E7NAL1_9EURY|nr:hypothetical protein [Natronosalvus rutilus]UTF54839.1 hypothetical protein NGM29_06130 [Natronosalvus rutilus]